MPHTIKRGDLLTLRWNLARDLTTVSTARVIISAQPGGTAAVDRNGTVDAPATAGIVSLALNSGDYDAGKLTEGVYKVEIETSPGPITHPDDGYETLTVIADLA